MFIFDEGPLWIIEYLIHCSKSLDIVNVTDRLVIKFRSDKSPIIYLPSNVEEGN